MSTDWDELDKEFEPKFKDYAPEGNYDVKLEEVEKKTLDSGAIVFDFSFAETDEYQYQKASKFFFTKNVNFRKFHYRNLMMVLGASKENANKAVDACEGKKSDESITEAYLQMFKRLIEKHPTVKIEVRQSYDKNGHPRVSSKGTKIREAVFSDPSVYFPADKKNEQADDDDSILDTSDDASDEIDISEIPFD